MFTGIKILKEVFVFGVSSGTGMIVKNIVDHTTPKNLGLLSKAAIAVGTFALSTYISDLTTEHIDAKLTELFNQWQSVRNHYPNSEGGEDAQSS